VLLFGALAHTETSTELQRDHRDRNDLPSAEVDGITEDRPHVGFLRDALRNLAHDVFDAHESPPTE
jgi:hypothetical protein